MSKVMMGLAVVNDGSTLISLSDKVQGFLDVTDIQLSEQEPSDSEEEDEINKTSAHMKHKMVAYQQRAPLMPSLPLPFRYLSAHAYPVCACVDAQCTDREQKNRSRARVDTAEIRSQLHFPHGHLYLAAEHDLVKQFASQRIQGKRVNERWLVINVRK
ncbi:MAG: hypothetical protein SGPRY_002387 [Prymnesium sp.]